MAAKLPDWMTSSIFPALIAGAAAVSGYAVTAHRVEAMEIKLARTENKLDTHVTLDGHPVVIERVYRVENRMNKIDDTTNRKIDKALSALARVCGKLNVDCDL